MIRSITSTSLILAAACTLFGQTTPAPLKFEVASVKRSHGGGPPGDIPRNMDTSPGHFAMANAPLRHFLIWAYELKDFEISGPDWIKTEERYDIIAKAGGPAPEDQVRQMLQTLLTERFQLKLHRETRELSVYVLAPGKGEPKVKPSTDESPASLNGNKPTVEFHKQPISRFTFMLTRRLDRPVLDQTGLKGLYDFSIDLSGLGFNGKEAEDPNAPSVFTTVQRDLNLKLESRKEPISILVVDYANKVPIEN
jgi:uncharacterized protein (TIGR03435 family)